MDIDQIPAVIMRNLQFEKIWSLKPEIQNMVIHNHHPVKSHRFYRSYGNVPPKDDDSMTYMFSDNDTEIFPIPEVFHPVRDFLNEKYDQTYNQLTVNWYESGTDYTPYHRDWVENMPNHAKISIVSIVESDDNPRNLVFRIDPSIRIACRNGICVTFGDKFLNVRHGVPQMPGTSQRISLSFRSYSKDVK